jgi:hypothetical protein
VGSAVTVGAGGTVVLGTGATVVEVVEEVEEVEEVVGAVSTASAPGEVWAEATDGVTTAARSDPMRIVSSTTAVVLRRINASAPSSFAGCCMSGTPCVGG